MIVAAFYRYFFPIQSMERRKIRKYWTIMDGGVLNRVTVHSSGKIFAPKVSRRPRFTAGWPNDRPGLISTIHDLLQVHSAQRMVNASNRRKSCNILHNALYKAIRMCFEQNISESKLFPIRNLFLELLYCDGNLASIFSILSSGHVTHPAVNILYNNQPEENLRAFEYYLHHISTIQTEEFGAQTGKPLDIINKETDSISHSLPLSVALVKREPALVLSLLRHGADPLRTIHSLGNEDDPNHVEQLIDDLNGFVLFQSTGFTETTRNILAMEEKKAWSCYSYFLRSVPSIVLSSESHITTNTDDNDNDEAEGKMSMQIEEPVRRTYQIHPLVAANLNMDYFMQTPKLMHICKCAIRRQIKEANKLSIPSAVHSLPLPATIKDYLDLMKD